MDALFLFDSSLHEDEKESKLGEVDASILYGVLLNVFHMFTLEFCQFSELASTFYVD